VKNGFGFLSGREEAVRVGCQAHSVGEDGYREIVDIVGDAVVATPKQSASAGGVGQRDGRTGGGAERQQRGSASRADDRVEVGGEGRIEVDVLDFVLEGSQPAGIEHGADVADAVRLALEEQPYLDRSGGIADAQPQKESVELGFRKWKGPGEVLRILRGDDEEGGRERESLAVDGDVPFVHGLQEGGLSARARAVDLVREKYVRKNGTAAQDEFASVVVEYTDAEDVARKKITRKLDAAKLAADCRRECMGKRCLADARNILDQQVAARQERDEGEFDGLRLTFKGGFDDLAQRQERRQLLGETRSGGHRARLARGSARRSEAFGAECGLAVVRGQADDGAVVAVGVVRASKVYGAVRALRTVTCGFEWGTVTVVRGRNGSGKSTLLGIVAGRGRPTSGSVMYGDGLGGHRGLERGLVGWVGHESLCYGDLSGRENIHVAARLYGLEEREAYREAADRFELASFAERPVRTYSRGQRQRISVARALIHRPKLVLLDEPTSGLDADGCGALARVVRDEARKGAVVIVATHDRAFADAIMDRSIRLDGGRLVTGERDDGEGSVDRA